jgi:hypothetical protein
MGDRGFDPSMCLVSAMLGLAGWGQYRPAGLILLLAGSDITGHRSEPSPIG